jgi:hypothetical protein
MPRATPSKPQGVNQEEGQTPPSAQVTGEAKAGEAKTDRSATTKPTGGRPAGGAAKPKVDIGNLDEWPSFAEQDEHINGLWWGREAAGKSSDVLTAANGGRVLVINAEGGLKKKPLRDFGINLDNIVAWPRPGQYEQLLTEAGLDQLFWRVKSDLLRDKDSWYAVVWDSASEMNQKLVRDVVLREVGKNAELPVAKRKEHRDNPYFLDRSDWGEGGEVMIRMLKRFRDLPVHFLVTALERRDVDEDTGRVVYGPAVAPAVQKDLLGSMDLVIECRADELRTGADPDADVVEEFVGRTRPGARTRAKDRLRALPRQLATPTFERVLAYATEALTETDDEVQRAWLEARVANRKWLEAEKGARNQG